MQYVKIRNISKKWLVLADNTKFHASLKPGAEHNLPFENLEDECIARPLAEGELKIIDMNVKEIKPVVTKPTKVEEMISRVENRGDDLPSEEDDETISGVKEGLDYVPPMKKVGKKIEQDLGQRLVKGKGSKKKLAKMVKTGGDTSSPVVKKAPFIKMQGNGGDAALDTGDIGTMIVNESGIPGQGKRVSISDLGDEDMVKMGKITNDILVQAEKDRKIAIYMTGDAAMRTKFVENSTDLDFLKEVAKMEWQGDLAKMVRSKIKEIKEVSV